MHNVGGVRYARLSAVNNCAMVKKVTNGIQEPWTEEDSLELRQVLSACRGGGHSAIVILAMGLKIAC